MPNIDLGQLTIPVFAAIFGAGWASCYQWIAKPMKDRLTQLEARQEALFQKYQEIVLKH